MEIYIIGHSNYTIKKLINMLTEFNIDCVVDIRGIPYSKYNIQFDKETIRYLLTKAGFKYIYMGEEFGAYRLLGKENNKGVADFDKIVEENIFKQVVERLNVRKDII